MKISIKILLLVIAIIVCVAAVLVFQKTIMQPPVPTKTINQFDKAMNAEVENFRKMQSVDSLETKYFYIINFAEFLNSQNRISESEEVEEVTNFINLYVPKFTQWSYYLFSKPIWHQQDLYFIEERIAVLKKFNINGNPIVSSSDKLELNKILSILDDFNEAKTLARQTSFTGIPQTKNKLSRAETYANKEYLKNNKALVTSLRELKGKIGKSHYYKIRSQVNDLKYFSQYSKDEFKKKVRIIIDEIDQYDNVAKTLYGEKLDVASLKNTVNDYEIASREYYRKNQEDMQNFN